MSKFEDPELFNRYYDRDHDGHLDHDEMFWQFMESDEITSSNENTSSNCSRPQSMNGAQNSARSTYNAPKRAGEVKDKTGPTENKKGNFIKYILFIAAVLCVLFLPTCITEGIHQIKVEREYDSALQLIKEGDYEAAESHLQTAYFDGHGGYLDSLALGNLCGAYEEYDAGNISQAYTYITGSVENGINDPDIMEQAQLFAETVATEYEIYKVEKERIEAERLAVLATKMPYVGMSEDDIGNTVLGEPDGSIGYTVEIDEKTNLGSNLCVDGIKYSFKNYDGTGTTLYVVCARGKVVEIFEPYPMTYSSRKSSDKYDVNRYSDPDDFYYDHYDDFFDYEDAEDYFNEHKN